jgi:putative FmdB family regulatory protein
MPNYSFQCNQCGERFEIRESVKQHDQHREKCPKCASGNVAQRYGGVYVKTSKKS